jgi:fructuronate reductase
MPKKYHHGDTPMKLPRLDEAHLADVPANIGRPRYARDKAQIGIVHFGPGAFHRAHQAAAFDTLLARDPRWGICEVALRTADVRNALAPQDGLYTLVELGEHKAARVIGAVKELLVAREAQAPVLARLASAETLAVTMTVTENGYCLTREGDLDVTRAEIQHDLANPGAPTSLVGWLVEGLLARRAAGLGPFTTVSCDNLVDNGAKLKRAVVQFAQERDRTLAEWITNEAPFPRTMVDSIVPKTDDALRADVRALIGMEDAWPIQREIFSQWVIEDVPGSVARDWAPAGVTITSHVAAYDRAKLRLLNGAHTTLAYVGSLLGFSTVLEAMHDAALAGFVERLMREDIQPSLTPIADFDLAQYIGAVLGRFRNPAMRHTLSQIAWDGSQKLGPRLLGTIADTLSAGRPLDRLGVPIAAWMLFLCKRTKENGEIVDPKAKELRAIAATCENRAESDVPKFLSFDTVFPRKLAVNAQFLAAVGKAYDALAAGRLPNF